LTLGINPVEGGVVPAFIQGTPLHYCLFGSAIPGMFFGLLGTIVARGGAAGAFAFYVAGMVIGQALIYWLLGASIERLRRLRP
jgi:hypothetical protein